MKSILARAAPGETGENRGLAMMVCPVCRKHVRERQIEHYQAEGNDDVAVELCGDCREEFESDSDVNLDSDTVEAAVFGKLWEFAAAAAQETAEQCQGLNEHTAPIVAEALGGEAWQSGGGIWLVVFRRADGHVVVISDDAVCQYENEAAFDASKAEVSVVLR